MHKILLTNLNQIHILKVHGPVTDNRKGPVTLCNFIKNLSRNDVAKQVAENITQCNSPSLTMFLFRKALHKVVIWSTFRTELQQLARPSHNVSVTPSATFLAIFDTLSQAVYAQRSFRLFLLTVILNFSPNNSPRPTPAKINHVQVADKLQSVTEFLFFQQLVSQRSCNTSC